MRVSPSNVALIIAFALTGCTDRPVTPTASNVSSLAIAAAVSYSAIDLGDLIPVAINESGLILGNENGHAAVWDHGAVTDLGTLGGPQSYAVALNNSGLAVGYSTTAAATTCPFSSVDPNCHAFLWDGTTMQDLGTLGGTFSAAAAISANGYVVGWSTIATGEYHAFFWDGAMHDLGTLGGQNSSAFDVNGSGHVVGYAQAADGSSHAFEWDGTVMTDLGGLGGTGSLARFIGQSGLIAGTSDNVMGSNRSVVWRRGVIQDLGTLNPGPGPFYDFNSFPVAMNASGDVTGVACTGGGPYCFPHGYLWDGVTMHDMGTMGGDESYPTAINARGDVVGKTSTPTEVTCTEPAGEMCHAFLWDGSFHDLGTPFGGFASSALDINNRGDVVGYSRTDDFIRGVLWSKP